MIVQACAEPGCETLVMGGYCLEHETPVTRVFVRGRPFVPADVTAHVARAAPVARTAVSPTTFRLAAPTRAVRTTTTTS